MKKDVTYTERELKEAMRQVSPGSMAAYDGQNVPFPLVFSIVCEMGFYNLITGKVKLDARTKAIMAKARDDVMRSHFVFAEEEA